MSDKGPRELHVAVSDVPGAGADPARRDPPPPHRFDSGRGRDPRAGRPLPPSRRTAVLGRRDRHRHPADSRRNARTGRGGCVDPLSLAQVGFRHCHRQVPGRWADAGSPLRGAARWRRPDRVAGFAQDRRGCRYDHSPGATRGHADRARRRAHGCRRAFRAGRRRARDRPPWHPDVPPRPPWIGRDAGRRSAST